MMRLPLMPIVPSDGNPDPRAHLRVDAFAMGVNIDCVEIEGQLYRTATLSECAEVIHMLLEGVRGAAQELADVGIVSPALAAR